MSRRRSGWIRLHTSAKVERDRSPGAPLGEDDFQGENSNKRKRFSIHRHYNNGVPQEGGHSQASIGEQENIIREGGHSQSGTGINPQSDRIEEGGHSQASTGKQLHYGHHGRYNDTIDF